MYHLTIDEIKRFLQEVPVVSGDGVRQRLMFKVTFHHGFRVSETINLTARNARDGFLNVRRLKGSLRTVQPFVSHPDPELDEAAELDALLKTLKIDDKLFPMCRSGVYRLMQRAGKRAGLPVHKLHPHVLKHSIAMASIGPAGIENVRQWLGHKSISSTGFYIRVTDQAASRAIGAALGSVLS